LNQFLRNERLTQSKFVSVSIILETKSVVDDSAKYWVLESKPSAVSKRGRVENCRGSGVASKTLLIQNIK
jgi:hypothetical protein